MTASFLAISACFYFPTENKARHVLLSLLQIAHPHTGGSIKACVDSCLSEWKIPTQKVLTVISDNGSNMVAAFKSQTAMELHSSSSSDDESELDSEMGTIWGEEVDHVCENLDRKPCVVHTLQPVVNIIHKESSLSHLLDKVCTIVRRFKRLSKATEKLLEACGLCLITVCPTRRSRTFNMVERLIQVKDSLCQLADQEGWDCLMPSEWQRLSALKDLLFPFAEHARSLQSDTMSLSLVLPALQDLSAHLSDSIRSNQHKDHIALSNKMKINLEERFRRFVDPEAEHFHPLAASACLLDPTVASETLLHNEDEEVQALLKSAEDYTTFCCQRAPQE